MNGIENNVDVKALSDNTANIGLANVGDVSLNFNGKGIANAIGTLAVMRRPVLIGDLREANADGIIRTAKKYQEAFNLDDGQAVMMAFATPTTPGQASNVFEVFEEAARILEERGALPKPPSEGMAAKMIDGAKNSEEWARDKWAALIAGELETPGTFSKAAMARLDEMSRNDALLFEKLCSVCTGGRNDWTDDSYEVLPYVSSIEPNPYGGSDLTNDDMIRLAALGLVDMAHFKDASMEVDRGYALIVHGEFFIVRSKGGNATLHRGSGLLTPFGQELASICEIGGHPGFLDFVRKDIERQGLELFPAEKADAEERLLGVAIAPDAGTLADRVRDVVEDAVDERADELKPTWDDLDVNYSELNRKLEENRKYRLMMQGKLSK